MDDYPHPLFGDEVPKPLRESLGMSVTSVIYREMWAVVFPNGRIVTGSDLETEERAWAVVLGWPTIQDIQHAQAQGVFATKARLTFSPPPLPHALPP